MFSTLVAGYHLVRFTVARMRIEGWIRQGKEERILPSPEWRVVQQELGTTMAEIWLKNHLSSK